MATPSSSSSLPSFAAALPTTRKPRSPVAGVLPGPKVETCLRLRAVLSADRWAHPQSARKHTSADDRIRPARPHVADDRVGDKRSVRVRRAGRHVGRRLPPNSSRASCAGRTGRQHLDVAALHRYQPDPARRLGAPLAATNAHWTNARAPASAAACSTCRRTPASRRRLASRAEWPSLCCRPIGSIGRSPCARSAGLQRACCWPSRSRSSDRASSRRQGC
jgi:hypothetical protein